MREFLDISGLDESRTRRYGADLQPISRAMDFIMSAGTCASPTSIREVSAF